MTAARALTVLSVCVLGACDCGSAPVAWRPVQSELRAPLFSAWEAPDGVLFAVGGNAGGPLILRHDAAGWWEMQSGTTEPLWWVFGFSSSHVYAVGEKGTITWFNGRRWEAQAPVGAEAFTLYGIWGTSPSDLWVVGGSPSLAERGPRLLRKSARDAAFADVAVTGTAGSLFKVSGTGRDDVWIVGEEGFAAHWDGAALTASSTGTKEALVTVVATRPGEAHVVGGRRGPIALQFDGSGWKDLGITDGQSRGLLGVARRGEEVIITGEKGLLLERREGVFQERVAGTPLSMHAVAATGAGFVAVGGDLLRGTRGVLVANHDLPSGPLKPWPEPGLPRSSPGDAGERADGGANGRADAGRDAGLGPGARCDANPRGCVDPDECWLLIPANQAICARYCQDASDCGASGPGACCEVPGPQVVVPVCIPAGLGGCPARDGG